MKLLPTLAILVVLVCSAPLAAQRPSQLDARAVARAEEMRSARATSSEVAQEMQRAFRLDAETSVRVLAAADYPAEQVASAGVEVFRTDPASLARYMATAGMDATTIAAGLSGGARVTGRAALDALSAARVPNAATTEVFRSARASSGEVAAFLQRRGEPAATAARHLVEGYREGGSRVVQLLISGGYPEAEVAAAGLGTLRLAPEDVAGAFRSARVPPERVATSLSESGLSSERTASAFRAAGFNAAETARAFVGGLGVESYQVYETLRGAGFTTVEVGAAVESGAIPLDMDCLDPNGNPVPCGNFGSGNNAPVMGQVRWSPHGTGEVGTVVTFESTNIPSVDVLLGGQALEVLEMTAMRVRARLPAAPTTGALAFRRQSDNVLGVIEDSYSVVAPPPEPMASVDWAAAADAALEGALMDADQWIMGSRFRASQCRVMAVSAIGTPGVLWNSAPFLGSIEIRLNLAGVPTELASAWQEAFEGAFLEWANNVTIPSLPWYPPFAAFPGPEAPPMPNVPMPLVSLVSNGAYAMTPPGLTQRLNQALPGADTPQAESAIADFANNLGATFTLFLSTATVMNVMGQGPVPAFAPPSVPVGPVVGGSCWSPGMWATAVPSGSEVTLPDLGGG